MMVRRRQCSKRHRYPSCRLPEVIPEPEGSIALSGALRRWGHCLLTAPLTPATKALAMAQPAMMLSQ